MADREIYKNRVIEVCPAGTGKVRVWHAFIDGFPIAYTRYGSDLVTSSYKTSMAAVRAARDKVDEDISTQSWLRQTDPPKAVELTKRRFEAAQKRLADARERLAFLEGRLEREEGHTIVAAGRRVEDAEVRCRRTQADLKVAERAMAAKDAHQSQR